MKKQWTVVLELTKLTNTEKIERAKEIYIGMAGVAYFGSPVLPLADFNAQIAKTEASYLASRDGKDEDMDTFHNDLNELERMMQMQANYVEIVANLSPDNGDVIIHSANMSIKQEREINIQNFAVENTLVKGKVKARMKKQAVGVVYVWDYKLKTANTWIHAAESIQARYTYSGLTSAAIYEFRGGYVLRNGDKIYFDPIEMVVL
jgi:hypothetical protein